MFSIGFFPRVANSSQNVVRGEASFSQSTENVMICSFLVSINSNRGPNGEVDDSPQAHLLFNASDVDNNGKLTRSEFHVVFQHFDADGMTKNL